MSDQMLTPGKNAPQEVDVIIEISPAQGPVKYEVCKDSGRLQVDRFLQTSMVYPCNYGYIPSTLSDDGDPCDVLVISPYDIIPGAIISVRPVGMLVMEDEAGLDNKILAVPVDGVAKQYAYIQSIGDVDSMLKDKIEHFFKHYKDLDSTKWVKLQGWQDRDAAIEEITNSINSFQS
ncbi:inorganic diphosphatase [Candidatus Synchoanobacter obligatus]|uniref:Inorganic pyrophosphatase n=1 Tax=Candidatus Synchoanobacter obligatus TaxID=2919597 RepID=A0ABT1L5L7_9GAMM|nr:inorganic diphosphatase [Candidatus Synchoanobacter obligatus]MCP8352442.1 inorganic diphosphatase [Candidatus Synchoanobacter obligatus]